MFVGEHSDVLRLPLQLAEIAIPHLLAASIFSAQNGGAVFYRNAKLLVVLCLVSGVFRLVVFCSDCAHIDHGIKWHTFCYSTHPFAHSQWKQLIIGSTVYISKMLFSADLVCNVWFRNLYVISKVW